jgi:hypothetical protein
MVTLFLAKKKNMVTPIFFLFTSQPPDWIFLLPVVVLRMTKQDEFE